MFVIATVYLDFGVKTCTKFSTFFFVITDAPMAAPSGRIKFDVLINQRCLRFAI